MARKPNSMYRHITQHAYTRRKYMGGVPMSRIQQYEMGDKKGDFPIVMTLHGDERCQVRHTSLESARVACTRYIERQAGKGQFHVKFRIFPHHVIRENKQATGAGADRVSQGMRQSFGKPVGTAARISPGQALMTIRCHPRHALAAKEALRKAGHKFCTPTRIIVEKGQQEINDAYERRK